MSSEALSMEQRSEREFMGRMESNHAKLTEFSRTVESFTQDYQRLYATYTSYRDMLRQVIVDRDQLRAEVERLRGERMVFVELVRDLLHVVDTIQPHSDEMNEIEMLHELTTRARSAIDGVLRAIEAAKEAK